MQSLLSTEKDLKTIRGKQRKPLGICIVISIAKWIFIKSQGRHQPGRIHGPVERQIGTSDHTMDPRNPSSLFTEDRRAKIILV